MFEIEIVANFVVSAKSLTDGLVINPMDATDYFALFHERLLRKMGKPNEVTKDETVRFRVSNRQSLLTDLINDGFHDSYVEVFNLDKDFGSFNFSQGIKNCRVSDQQLRNICSRMRLVETARRENLSVECYANIRSLAFEFTEVAYLREHFLKKAFRFASSMEGTEGQKSLADSHKNLGKHFFRLEKYDLAFEHLNNYMVLVDQSEWSGGEAEMDYKQDACNELRMFYTRLGELSPDPEQALEHFQLAKSYAELCKDDKQIKQSNYKMG